MPVLGIVASQISGHLFAPSGAYDSIATVSGTGSASTITFSSIPSTYTHLQLRGIGRSTTAGTGLIGIKVTYNSDTTSGNYTFHRLIGDGASASAYGQSGIDFILRLAENGLTAGMVSGSVVDVLDYANTNKYKTTRALTGADINGSGGIIGLYSQLWMNTAAITSITLTTSSGNFGTTTQFALYGIKGA